MHFLITAGGTREYIDPVRFISNASSGRMGYALTRAALCAGHEVTLITTPVALKPPGRARTIEIQTAAQMFDVIKKHFVKCDCLIMAAAVSDYTPARKAKTKIKKNNKPLIIKLKPTTDILKWAGKRKGHKDTKQLVVGFALEDKKLRERAEKKLKEKNLDMIIANTTTSIGTETSTVQIKRPGLSWVKIERTTKASIAKKIIALLAS